jgi:hypothetical protein
MSDAERARRYRARQRGQVEGNERRRPGTKPDLYRCIRDFHREVQRLIGNTSEDDLRRMFDDLTLAYEDGEPDRWYITVHVPVSVPADVAVALRAEWDAEVQAMESAREERRLAYERDRHAAGEQP